MKFIQNWLDRLWDLAAKKGAGRVLKGVSFTEAIFFPIPPDLMLIPMSLAQREQAFRLARTCLLYSLAGGVAGYFIGYFFMEVIGWPIINFYGLQDKYLVIQNWYSQYSAWAVAVAGLTPIPYKLCTLTAGAFEINLLIFVVASAVSRGARFFAIAALAHFFGDKARVFLQKRFDLILVGSLVLLILGFLIIKVV
ncbi:MAG: YqaA family protein [Desulfovibrionales bacterium]